jgi:Gram-negative bacterial TonB protein C-terminal
MNARALLAAALVGACVAAPAEARKDRPVPTLDPVGTWNCVVYGHPAFGDERVLLHLARDGTVRAAHWKDDEISPWVALTSWQVEDATMTFIDSRSGRAYEADLTLETLGGKWRTPTLLGGWWCSPAELGVAPTAEKTKSEFVMAPLLPTFTATPVYPIKAIREAKQGRAVSCFLVDADGNVLQPEIVELSDEIFRAPILYALARSRYQPLPGERALRPGCRSFLFRLESLLGEASVSE